MSPNTPLLGVSGSRWRLSTPSLVLDLDVMESNLELMAAHCRATGQALRPHAKSHKCTSIAKAQIAAGAVGVCCATIHEAEVMVAAGVPVLITSPPTGEAKVARLMVLHGTTEALKVATDTLAHVAALAAATAAAGIDWPLALVTDFDVGTHRTGAATATDVVVLAQAIEGAPGLKFAGVQAYYGHLQHIEDYVERTVAVAAENMRLGETVDALRAAGFAVPLVTGGGTGSYDMDHRHGLFNELQAGSYVFTDVQYNAVALREDEARPFAPSLFVQASVINDVHDSHAIIDAGLKSFATDGPEPEFAVRTPLGASYKFFGDEHGAVVYGEANERLEVGAQLACLVPHCDPTVNLYDTYHCVRGDTLVDIWPIEARGNP
ncbi:MAG TPA: DSD1 family PLP-dependent enzyme [Alphaproteobacteria bacterium]|nr:DSD1 family PLP-dependent enzyme [Alphaproteobacteria bacterium]